jgi:hypothetical protein
MKDWNIVYAVCASSCSINEQYECTTICCVLCEVRTQMIYTKFRRTTVVKVLQPDPTYRAWNSHLPLPTDTQFYCRQKKAWPSLNGRTLKRVMFLRKYTDRQFVCGHTLTGGVFVTQLSSNVGISVWRTVWLTANRLFITWNVTKPGPHKVDSLDISTSLSVAMLLQLVQPVSPFCFLLWFVIFLPAYDRCRGWLLHLITLSDMDTHGRTPLGEWSARRTSLYLTTHKSHKTQTSTRTRNPSKLAAADPLRL